MIIWSVCNINNDEPSLGSNIFTCLDLVEEKITNLYFTKQVKLAIQDNELDNKEYIPNYYISIYNRHDLKDVIDNCNLWIKDNEKSLILSIDEVREFFKKELISDSGSIIFNS